MELDSFNFFHPSLRSPFYFPQRINHTKKYEGTCRWIAGNRIPLQKIQRCHQIFRLWLFGLWQCFCFLFSSLWWFFCDLIILFTIITRAATTTTNSAITNKYYKLYWQLVMQFRVWIFSLPIFFSISIGRNGWQFLVVVICHRCCCCNCSWSLVIFLI